MEEEDLELEEAEKILKALNKKSIRISYIIIDREILT